MKISQQVGLHPQLVAFDVTKANGINVGFNPSSTGANRLTALSSSQSAS